MTEVFRIVAKIQTNAKVAIAELGAVHSAGAKMATKLRASFMKVANFATKILKVAIVAVGVAAAVMFVSAVKRAAAFEQSMAMVKAVTGATGKEFEDLEKKAKSLGQTSKFTMVQIAEGMEFLGRAGFTTNQIIDAMDGVVALAASQMMELGRAADITSNILTAFGLDAGEASRVANLLAATAASANVNVEMLGETMKYAAPLAEAAGWSLESMAAAAGKLGNAGIQASMAGTALRMVIATLMEASEPTAEALEKLGLTMEDLKDRSGNLLSFSEIIGIFEEAGADASNMLDLFGKRAGPAMAILLKEGQDSLEAYTEEITGTSAAFEQMAIQQDTLSGQTTILKGSWDLFMVTMGQKIIPHLKTLVQDILIPMVNRMVEWAEKTDIIDKLMAKFNATIKWIIDNGPKLLSIIKGIGLAIAAMGIAGFVASMGPLQLIIIAVTAALVLAKEGWSGLKDMLAKVHPLLPKIALGFAAIVAVKLSLWVGTAISSFASLAAMLGAAGPVGLAIAAALAGLYLLRKVLMGAAEDAQIAIDKAEDLEGALSKAATSTERMTIATEAMGAILNIAGGELVGLVENGGMSIITLSEIGNRMEEMGKAAIAAGGSNASMIKRIRDGVADILNDYTDLVPGVSDALDRINERIGKAGEEVEELGDTTEETTVQFQQMGGAFDEFGASIDAFGPRAVETTEATEDLGDVTEEFAETTRFTAEALEDEREAIVETGGALADLGAETDETGDAVDGLGDDLEETGEEAETLSEKFLRLKEAFEATTVGSYEQSQAIDDLKSFYGVLVTAQETLVESGIEVDQALLSMIKNTRKLIDVTIEVEKETTSFVGLLKKAWKDMIDNAKSAGEILFETATDMWSMLKTTVIDTLGNMLNGIVDYYRDRENAAKDHADEILGIEEDHLKRSEDLESGYQDNLTDADLTYKRKREDIETDYRRALQDCAIDDVDRRTQIENDYREDMEDAATSYARRREDLEIGYTDAVGDLADDRQLMLDEEADAYEEQEQTIWEYLGAMLHDLLVAVRSELMLAFAKHLALAAAWALIPPLFVANPSAIGHGAAAAGLLAASLGLALAGFAKGALVSGPMVGLVGEGPDDELIMPLNRSVLADVGAGIVQATQAEGMSMSSQEITINVAEGATFHVREEGDIDRISRALGDEFDIRLREEGLVLA